MKNMIKIILLCFCIPGHTSMLFAQGTWTSYTTEDGLADNRVVDIAVDANNVKWFTTAFGVSSFDGSTWNTYTDEDGLLNNNVSYMAVDKNNVKWFVTGDGLSCFDDTTWTTYRESDGLIYDHVFSIAVDDNNVKWFGSWYGVCSFDDTTWATYYEADDTPMFAVFSVAVDSNNTKWFVYQDSNSDVSGYGLVSYDDAVWTAYQMRASGEGQYYASHLAVDQHNVKWFEESHTGIVSFSDSGTQTYTEINGHDVENRVIDIEVDSQNNKWFGTTFGAVKYDGVSWEIVSTEDGLVHNTVLAISFDQNNFIWFGTNNGVSCYEGFPVPVEESKTPAPFAITGNHPNPFNPETTIEFTLDTPAEIGLAIYDITGRKVKTLTGGNYPAGSHAAIWDGSDSTGMEVASGVYFARLVAGGRTAVHRMLLVR